MNNPTLELTKTLISHQSVTPHDVGCQDILAERLQKIGFNIENLQFGDEHGEVTNLWARRGDASPLVVFAGHTDVVPAGDLSAWQSEPFTPEVRDGLLYGRGAADMKTSLAAFITAIESYVEQNPDHDGSIGLLITSDEEGPATCGTVKVIETLEARNEKIDYCVVGEPSSTKVLGDVIKNGRRGSIGCKLSIYGTQGHIAYPHLADNPIHKCGEVIKQLTSIEWDKGNDYFPPTSFQISNINAGTGATNVIPGEVKIMFNLRFSTEISDKEIRDKIETALSAMDIEYKTDWTLYGLPFLTPVGKLVDATVDAIKSELGIDSQLSTAGGTSDGRFIAPTGAEVIELGPVNESIHKINECVDINAPDALSNTYRQILQNLLG